jgi:Uma2 family endonuclease
MKTASFEIDSLDVKVKPDGKMTYEEFLDWCDEDRIVEWVNGDVIMASPASAKHQRIGSFLEHILYNYVESRQLGETFRAPFQMKLDFSGREPDIIYISSSHIDQIKKVYMEGPADMVVEIISTESRKRDRKDKFAEYESAGITEYWLIDPIRERAEFYRLGEDNLYHLVLISNDGIYRSEVISGFWLNINWLWKEPLPRISEVIKELEL